MEKGRIIFWSVVLYTLIISNVFQKKVSFLDRKAKPILNLTLNKFFCFLAMVHSIRVILGLKGYVFCIGKLSPE